MVSQSPERDDLQVADYANVLRRRWWLIVALAIVGLLGGVAYYKVAHKLYTATAAVYVTAPGATANQVANGRTSGAVNLDTEAQLVQSATVGQAAAKLMHATDPLPVLLGRVSVSVPANSQVLQISCQARSGSVAAACAQSFAQAFLNYTTASTTTAANSQIAALQARVGGLQSAAAKLTVEISSLPDNSPQRATAQQQLNSDQSQLSSLNSQVAALTAELANPSGGSIISNATAPSSPTSPKALLVLPSGLLVGLLVGLIAAFAWDRRDHRIRGPRDLARIGLPALLTLPRKQGPAEPVIAPPRSAPGREFARLAQVVTGSLEPGTQVILVTSARPGHGASLVAANLAVALSRSQPDVTLVCADLEGSVIPDLMGLPRDRGLTDLLAGTATAGDTGAWVPAAPRLRVIGPGTAAVTETEDLRQDAVTALLASLRATARWIVLEAASLTAGPDAYTLARAADAAVLVVEVPRTTSDEVVDSLQLLRQVGTTVLGTACVPAAGVPAAAGPAQSRQDGREAGAAPSGPPHDRGPGEEQEIAGLDWPAAKELPNATPRA